LALDADVEEAVLRLKVKKAGAVTAGQLELPAGVTVV